jgi:hypothetical protein
VARIELIRGGSPGIDMQGQPVVANVILLRTVTTERVFEAEADVLADGQASHPAEPGHTLLRCQLLEVLSLGEISLCTLRPEALPSQAITLNLTTRLLERLQAQAGGWVQLLIAPGALHIMPVRTSV